jgi:hypothetical protein
MAIEIRELIVRAVIDVPPARDSGERPEAEQQAIVDAAVREVLAILRRREDR